MTYILSTIVGPKSDQELSVNWKNRNPNLIQKVSLCGGAGAFLIPQAVRSGADVFITGEIKYHDYFGRETDILLAEIGHYESEQYTKEIFYSIIRDLFPNFALQFSKVNTNPIKYL